MGKHLSEAPLSAAECRRLFSINEDGDLIWRESYGRRKLDEAAGHVSGGYRRIGINRIAYQAHHIAYFWHTGIWPMEEVDHIDGIRLNNKISNLRLATRSENGCNRKRNSNNKSGFRGVHFVKTVKKWRATIMKSGQRHHLGLFETAELAAMAYREAAIRLHGEFARI